METNIDDELPGAALAEVSPHGRLLFQTLKLSLKKQERAATIAKLQAQIDRFVAYFNDVRPDRAKGRKPPRVAFESRDKAAPRAVTHRVSKELRVRHVVPWHPHTR
jgi:hypothetical protein